MNDLSPEPARPRRPWALWLALVPVALIGLRLILVEHENKIRALSPGCVFHRLTGLHCPGCGGTRAVFALAKGNVATAWSMNPLIVAGLVAGAFYFAVAAWEKYRGQGRVLPRWLRISDRGAWMIAVGVVVFGVVRNIPVWPFSLLAPH